MDMGLFKDSNWVLIMGVSAFCLGVFVAAGEWIWVCGFIGMGLVFGRRIELKITKGGLILIVACLIGVFRFQSAIPVFDLGDVAGHHSENEMVVMEGVVVDYPDVRRDEIKLTVDIDHLNDELVTGRVLISVFRYPEYSYGDRLKIWGFVITPVDFESFSYRRYLRRYGIHSVMYSPSVELLEESVLSDWRFFVYEFKSVVEKKINRLFPEPYASFSAGLLLGSRRGIPEKLMEAFNRSGLTHIIAISGYNITLIIVFVSGFLKSFSRRSQVCIASVFIVIFTVFVGATAAVVRAAIMGVLGLWALWFGRTAEVTRLLVLTAGMMVFWNPFILVDDVGFQLSFAATCGLIYATPWVEVFLKWTRCYEWIPENLSIREAFVTSLAAQFFALPIIVLNFERLSLVAPFANVFVAALIPLAMVFSFVALIVSWIWWEGGLMVAYVAWFFLELIIQVAQWSAEIPWASVAF